MLRVTLLGAVAAVALGAAPTLAQPTPPTTDPMAQPGGTPATTQGQTGTTTTPTPDSTSADQPASQPTDTTGQAGTATPTPMASGQAPMASGGAMANVPGNQAADTAGFAPQPPAGATEEQVVQGDGQLEQSRVTIGGTTVNVTASTPVPNPPEGTTSSSPGRGAGREGAAPRRRR